MATQQKFFTVLPDNSIGPTIDYTGISSVYTSKANRSGQMEMVMQANDIDVSLNQYDFSQRGVAYITPATSLLKQVILAIKVSGVVGSDWVAHSLIREFGYRLPGCERMIFSGDNLLFKQLGECENMDKRIALLRAAGIRTRAIGSVDIGTTNHFINSMLVENVNERIVYCILPLPCSSVAADDGTVPFPLHMIQSSLEMDFLFRYKSDVVIDSVLDTKTGSTDLYAVNYNYSSSNAYSSSTQPSIKEARVYYTYEALPNMDQYKDTVYKYPFQALYDNYANLNIAAADQATHFTNTQDRIEFALKGLRNGEITQLAFRFAPDPSTIGNRRYNGLKLSDIRLTYAGQTIYRQDGDSNDAWSSFYNILPNYWVAPLNLYLSTATAGANFVYGLKSGSGTGIDNVYPTHNPIANIYATPGIGIHVMEGTRRIPYAKTTGGTPNVTNATIIDYNTASGPQWYYILPIAEKLDHIRKGAYNLGCDFKDSDLKLSFRVLPQGITGTEDTPTGLCFASVANGGKGDAASAATDTNPTHAAITNYVLYYQYSITSQYQFDGLSAKLIQ